MGIICGEFNIDSMCKFSDIFIAFVFGLGLNPGLHVTCRCHVSLVSINLEQILSFIFFSTLSDIDIIHSSRLLQRLPFDLDLPLLIV